MSDDNQKYDLSLSLERNFDNFLYICTYEEILLARGILLPGERLLNLVECMINDRKTANVLLASGEHELRTFTLETTEDENRMLADAALRDTDYQDADLYLVQSIESGLELCPDEYVDLEQKSDGSYVVTIKQIKNSNATSKTEKDAFTEIIALMKEESREKI